MQLKTFRDLLIYGRAVLKESPIQTYALDAELLLMHAAGLDSREELLLMLSNEASKSINSAYQILLERRLKFEPIAQLMGQKEFWSLPFAVNQHVLTPRPETEHIIEQVFLHFKMHDKKLRILDLGTGSGCIVLSLLKEYKKATAVAADISKESLSVAQNNAQQLGLQDRLTLIKSDWFSAVKEEKFDIIVANPPYLSLTEWQNLPNVLGVKEFEPKAALTDGEDGLGAYRKIAANLPTYLAAGGMAFFEFGQGQENAVSTIFANFQTKLIKDLAGIYRVIIVL